MSTVVHCPQCQQKGIQSLIKTFVCGWFHTAYLCENIECTYPLEEDQKWLFESSNMLHKTNQKFPETHSSIKLPSNQFGFSEALPGCKTNFDNKEATSFDLDFLDDIFEDSDNNIIRTQDLLSDCDKQKEFRNANEISCSNTLGQPCSTPALSYPSFSSSQKSGSSRNSIDDIIPSMQILTSSDKTYFSSVEESTTSIYADLQYHYSWMSTRIVQHKPSLLWLHFLQHMAVYLRCLHPLSLTAQETPLGRLQSTYEKCLVDIQHQNSISSQVFDTLCESLRPRLRDFSVQPLLLPMLKESFPLLTAFQDLISREEGLKDRFSVTYSQSTRCEGCGIGCSLERSSSLVTFSYRLMEKFSLSGGALTVTDCEKCGSRKTVRTTFNKISSCLIIHFRQRLPESFKLDSDWYLHEGLSPVMLVESTNIRLGKVWIRHPDKSKFSGSVGHWLCLHTNSESLVQFEEKSLADLASPSISLVLLERPLSSSAVATTTAATLTRLLQSRVGRGGPLSVDIDQAKEETSSRNSAVIYTSRMHRARSTASMPTVLRGGSCVSAGSTTGMLYQSDQTYLLTRYLANEVKQGSNSYDTKSSIPRGGNSYLDDLQQRQFDSHTLNSSRPSNLAPDRPPSSLKRQSVQTTLKDLVCTKAKKKKFKR